MKNLKALLCIFIAALLPAGCAAQGGAGQETTAATAASTQPQTTEPQTTAVPETTAPASPDSAGYPTAELDYLAIKQNLSEIQSTLDDLISDNGFLGAVYAKIGTDFDYLKARGVANNGAHINNSVNTRFYAGSVTKLVTSIAALKLAEEKKLDLDTTIDKYFPGCGYAKSVTVRQLLNMTSGIPNYIERDPKPLGGFKCLVPGLQGKVDGGSAYSGNKAEILEWILSRKLTAAKTPVFSYSDSNYYLLGEIISQAAGTSYEDYVDGRIFKPLYMTKSGFTADDSTAKPYTGFGKSAQLMYEGAGYSSLGLITNVSDLLKLIDGLLSYQVINKNSFTELITDNGSGFGCGVYVNGNRLSCIGSVDAYSAKLSFTTDKKQIFAALSNYSDADPNYIQRLFGNYLTKFSN